MRRSVVDTKRATMSVVGTKRATENKRRDRKPKKGRGSGQ
jgi:hypothetical protein